MLKQLSFRSWIVDVKNGGYSEIGDALTNYHPSMSGWTSEKFSLFPQTIIFQVPFESIDDIKVGLSFLNKSKG